MTELNLSFQENGAQAASALEWPAVPGYEILSELGQGGMGVIFKATQLSTRRLVALKLIRSGALASSQDRARFRTEADAVSRLQHPNIVRIFEFGDHLGQPYFAMEIVEGGRLDQLLAGQPLAPLVAAGVVRSLAHAIQHVHNQKIIHRDLKPANILIRADQVEAMIDGTTKDASSQTDVVCHYPFTPVITDFGLAKRLDGDSTVVTQAGAILGTASYMAPEQADGTGRVVGPAADIYALGAILYELVAGRPPFKGGSWSETLEQVIRDDPPRLSNWGVTVPTELETVCLRCLEKDPGSRYATAMELAADLERFLSGQSVLAVAASERNRITRRAARDGYTIVAEVGRGPRSTVYQTTFGPLQQPMALKVFDRDVCSEDEWNARLERGTPIWSALNHPQVVLARQAGWWDGAPFLAVEFAPQGSLASSSRAQRYSVHAALQLAEQLAVVTCYLHRQGVVHGNLKPSNVLLAADGIPRVVDISAVSGLSFGPLPTAENTWKDLAYVAPEMLDDPTVEPRQLADVYAIGAILYELLAGRPPFVAATAEHLLEQIRSTDPEPIMSFNPEVSAELDGFCQRCLRKSPWSRYARVYNVLSRVRHFLSVIDGTLPANPRKR